MLLLLIMQIGLGLLRQADAIPNNPNNPKEEPTAVEAEAILPEQTRELYAAYPTDKAHFYIPIDSVREDYPIPLAGYHTPLRHMQITSKYGIRDRQMHYGTDLLTEVGDTIFATYDGIVRQLQTDYDGYGQYLILRHPNGLESLYGHVSKYLVKKHQAVQAGDPIALAGNSGRSTGPHLHLEFGFMGQPINPERMIDLVAQRPYYEQFRFNKATCHRAYRWKPLRMREYVVQPGDTWDQLASKLRRSPKLLAKLNQLDYKAPLQEGQIIAY